MNFFCKYLSVIFFSVAFSAGAQTNKDLSADEFEKGIARKDTIQLLDVRTPGEYKGGHLKNALLADWQDKSEFNRRIGFIDKQKPVYIYCLSGGRSAAAAEKMREMGYQNVYELKGGINAWKQGHKEVEAATALKQMSVDELNESIHAGKYVLVDFGAEWCPPCKLMAPVIDSLQQLHPNTFSLVKVDGGRDEDILAKYKVTTLPVYILFKNGEQVWRKDGIATEKEIAGHFK